MKTGPMPCYPDPAMQDRTPDPVLRRFRAALEALYGDRLARVVLFGSRARGDARADSDYDVAVFLRDQPDYWTEIDRMSDIVTDVLMDEGAVISAKPFGTAARGGLLAEIRRDGVEV